MTTVAVRSPVEICAHFGVCGGCSTQDHSYLEQISRKENQVKEFLKDLPVQNWQPIMASPEKFYYRNKMEYSFGDEKDILLINKKRSDARIEFDTLNLLHQVHLGLHPKGRFSVVTPTHQCLLQSPESTKIISAVAEWATEFKIPVYVRPKNKGVLRHLVIREGKNTGERLVNLVTTSQVTNLDVLAIKLKNLGAPISTFLSTIHDGLSDTVQGDVSQIFWGDGFIREKVDRLIIKFPATSFMQTNTHAAENMIRHLRAWIVSDLAPRKKLFDFYCGVGTIGLNLSDLFEQMIGVELDEQAIQEAQSNAALNIIRNTQFYSGKTEDHLQLIKNEGDLSGATLIVDPPRPGLHSRVVNFLLTVNFPTIYYISCKPESLGRDLRQLISKYTIDTVQPMDFFPHTEHVETLVKLTLK